MMMVKNFTILFALASIGLSAITIIVLLIHRLFRNRKTRGSSKRLNVPVVCTSGAFVCLVIAITLIFGADKMTKSASFDLDAVVAQTDGEEKAFPPLPTRHLGVTPVQFAKNFNEIMKQSQLPFRVNPAVTEGKNAFIVMLNDHIGIAGTLGRGSEYLDSVVIMGRGDGTDKSGMNIVMTAFAGIAAIFPDIDRKQISSELQALMDEGLKAPNRSASRIMNGVKLTFNKIDQVGNSFNIVPLE